MIIFDGEQPFESFYLKHFNSFQDLQNCTECFKNLSIYSSSIYYQVSQSNTGSFKRILTENDEWLDDNFLKKYGNSFGEDVYVGSNDNFGIGFQTNNIPRFFITNNGLTGFGTNQPSASVDIFGTFRVSSTTTLPISTSIGVVNSSEISFLSGVTGSIQNQINSRLTSTSASLLYFPYTGGTLTGALILQYSIRLGGTGNSDGNTFFGRNSFISRTTGINNTGFGANVFSSLTSATGNIAIGNNTGASITTGSNNILIGNAIGSSITTGSNHINIGNRILYSPFGVFQLNSYTSSGFLTNDSSGNFITDTTTIPSLRSFTSSINTYTSSVDISLNNFSSYTASLNVSTGSFFKQGGNSFGTSAILGTNDNNSLSFETNDNIRMFISNNGNVGIGTLSPISKLAVDIDFIVGSQGGNDIVYITGGAGYGSLIETRYADGAVNNSLRGNSDTILNRFYGNVGIGTTSPISKLTVIGDGMFNNNVTVSSSLANEGGQITLLRPSNGTKDWAIDNYQSNFRILNDTDGIVSLIATSSGSVGIGTGTPSTSAKLDITSTTSGLLFPRMTTSQKNAITALAGLVVYDTTLSKLQVYTTTWENLH